jgi:maleate isomerase
MTRELVKVAGTVNPTSWQPDGWDAHTRIGVLAPHADVGPESELQAMAPQGVRIYGARVLFTAMGSGGVMDPTIPHAPVRAFAEPPHIDEAAELIAAAPVNAIAIGFTSTAYVLGADGERALVERLMAHTHGIPVVSTCASIVEGLRELGAARIAMFDPPWFDDELTRLGRDHYTRQGLDVVHATSCDLASTQSAIRQPDVYEWIRAHTPDTADAVVVGGNGFRAIGVIDALEQALARPMLTANQALFWGALRAADAGVTVNGYGRLLDRQH